MKQFPLRGQPNQRDVNRLDPRKNAGKDIPLGRGCQGNTEAPLQPLEAIERHPASVFQHADHAANRRIVFRGGRFLGRRSSKDRTAEMTTQPFEFIQRALDRSLAHETHQHARRLLVKGTLETFRTRIARLQIQVRHGDSFRSPVRAGAVAAVPFALLGWLFVPGTLPSRFRRGLALRGRLALRRTRHGLGLFRRGAEEHLL